MDRCKIYTGISSLVDGTVKEYLSSEKSQELFSAKVSSSIVDGIENVRSTFVACKDTEGRFFIDLEFPAWQDSWFIFIPSACYDGNRFTLIPEPPMKLFVVDFDGQPKDLFPLLAQAVKLYLREGEQLEMVKADIRLLRAAEQASRPIYEKA